MDSLHIIPKYRKVIVGVSEDVPEKNAITTPIEIMMMLKDFFKEFTNVDICIIKGVLIKNETAEGLPKFDILLSGNPEVIAWARKCNLESKYIERSVGTLSGTIVRKIMNEEDVTR